jgi:hypothetical protein
VTTADCGQFANDIRENAMAGPSDAGAPPSGLTDALSIVTTVVCLVGTPGARAAATAAD